MGCRHLQAQFLAGGGALFLLGLAGGLHCAGMCGPLACLLGQPERRPARVLALYHLARLAAYAALGAAFAALGAPLRPLLSWPLLALLAALPLAAYALLGDAFTPAWLARLHAAGARALAALPAGAAGLGLGLLTPLLPCGLLYAAAGCAVSAPSPGTGAAWLAAFGAGTLPWLLLGQAGYSWAQRTSRPALARGLRRGAAALAAASILFLSFLG
ncbi:MAG TPA: sulfite exporter TauE/SafE family protein [bacterium]|jgi:sulfite exporter TauE/SafE|nr:sulfite exporter TauE/SafE family protein [bacterium]HXC63144.1 sulfite exporter TauE/SafE family protein [bacterium]